MNPATKAEVGGRVVGEYVDEGDVPADGTFHRGEAVRPSRAHAVTDTWVSDADVKVFTVLLLDGRVLAVRGHELKVLPAGAGGDRDSYGIVYRAANREELVAVFKTTDVSGIFHGELRPGPTAA